MKSFSINSALRSAALMLLVFVALTAGAKEVTIGKLRYKVNTTDKIAKCCGLAEEATKNYNLTIPSTVVYDGVTLKVTTVEKEAFIWDTYLKKVTLSDYTETIGSKAFYCCENLSVVSLGKKLKIIGAEAFAHAGLNGTFTSITFPSTLEIIRDKAFEDCRYLATINFNDKLQSIGVAAFWGCESVKSLLLPGSLQTISSKAFESCGALTEVTFISGNGNTVIGEDSFDNNKALTILNFQGPGVAEIGAGAFCGCALQWIYIPPSVHTIGQGAFFSNQISILELSEGLKVIGEIAFHSQRGDGISALTIPSTVTSIGPKAFDHVGVPPIVKCNAVNPPAAGEEAFNDNVRAWSKLVVPAASLAKYRAAAVWKDFRYINDTDSHEVGVELVEMSPDEAAVVEHWYDLHGNRVDPANCAPGIYIVSHDGRFEKRILK